MTQTPTKPTPTLDYAPDGSHRRRRLRRFATLAVLLLVLAAAWVYRRPLMHRAEQLYWSRQCARFSVPSDTPRWISDPKLFSQFKNGPLYALPENLPYHRGDGQGRAWLIFAPHCWQRFARSAGARPYHFYGNNTGTIFLQELRTPSGKRRIVHLECVSENMLAPAKHLVPTIIEPPGLFHPPRIIHEPTGAYAISERFVPCRLFIGQPDPNDRSHFTIRFQTDPAGWRNPPERHGIIDGYLGDDDKITYRIRDPATTQRL